MIKPIKPSGLQKIVENYTKLVFKRCYDIDDFYVFFSPKNQMSFGIRAIYRDKKMHPDSGLHPPRQLSGPVFHVIDQLVPRGDVSFLSLCERDEKATEIGIVEILQA